MNSCVPFFIVGCSRSGTTLLQALIDAHPRLAIPPESQIYTRFGRVFHTYGEFSDPANQLRFLHDLLDDSYIRRWKLTCSAAEVAARVKTPTRAGVITALFEAYATRKNAARWGDKTPEHVRHLAAIRSDFPNARLIHLARDGRDTAEALRRMTWAPVTAVGLAQEWRREVSAWLDFCNTHGSNNTLVVRYEDMVVTPGKVIETILRFLEEPFIDTSLSYSDTELSQSLSERKKIHSSLNKGINAAKIGVYRQKFTQREIEIIENIAGDVLTQYGYVLDCNQPQPPSRWQVFTAPYIDRLTRWYRKLFMPEAFIVDLQFRWRTWMRHLRHG